MSAVLSTWWKRLLVVGYDAFAWGFAFIMLMVLRYNVDLGPAQWTSAVAYTLTAVGLQMVLGFVTHLYLGRSRVASFAEFMLLGMLVLAVGLVVGAIFLLAVPSLPDGITVALPPLALLVMVAGRGVFRGFFRNGRRRRDGDVVEAEAQPVLVFGAGDLGHEVARLVNSAPDAPYEILGFVDDDRSKNFLRVEGHRVLGTREGLVDLVRTSGAEAVILSIGYPSQELVQSLAEKCSAAGVKLVVVPPASERIGGRVELGGLRELDVVDLLGRRPIETDLSEISGYLNGKVVLITGAGGSIGSELAKQVNALGPAKLFLLDRDESALHSVQLDLYGKGLLDTEEMILCDIRDEEALDKVFQAHKPEVVFHAAALKHLPMLERFPDEGWKTNVLGSLNVLRCARRVGVERFVNVSTDKAADATSVLGQTKRLAEQLTAWHAREFDLDYVSVRFGNVLGSRGSVLHTFRKQIERGGPITVTHPEVTRYFMTIPEACELVLQAGAIGRAGEVLVLDMGEPVKILEVARRMIDIFDRHDVAIEFSGMRQGEKLHEVLLSTRESPSESSHPLITHVSVPPVAPDAVSHDQGATDRIEHYLSTQGSRGDAA